MSCVLCLVSRSCILMKSLTYVTRFCFSGEVCVTVVTRCHTMLQLWLAVTQCHSCDSPSHNVTGHVTFSSGISLLGQWGVLDLAATSDCDTNTVLYHITYQNIRFLVIKNTKCIEINMKWKCKISNSFIKDIFTPNKDLYAHLMTLG